MKKVFNFFSTKMHGIFMLIFWIRFFVKRHELITINKTVGWYYSLYNLASISRWFFSVFLVLYCLGYLFIWLRFKKANGLWSTLHITIVMLYFLTELLALYYLQNVFVFAAFVVFIVNCSASYSASKEQKPK